MAACVGGWMVARPLLAAGGFRAVEALAAEAVQLVAEARAGAAASTHA